MAFLHKLNVGVAKAGEGNAFDWGGGRGEERTLKNIEQFGSSSVLSIIGLDCVP